MHTHDQDFIESLWVFGLCFVAFIVIQSIHATYFLPYIEKTVMVDLSLTLTLLTGAIALYEGISLPKPNK